MRIFLKYTAALLLGSAAVIFNGCSTSEHSHHHDADQLRLPGSFVSSIQERLGFSAVLRPEAFLLFCLGILDVEHPADFSAVEDETLFHSTDFCVRCYEAACGVGCISYTRQAANPVISSGCRLLPGFLTCNRSVLISLALASSGFCNSLQNKSFGVGGEGRNRTDECSFCRAVPYHLATPPSGACKLTKFAGVASLSSQRFFCFSGKIGSPVD
jgi:hypothetical protein